MVGQARKTRLTKSRKMYITEFRKFRASAAHVGSRAWKGRLLKYLQGVDPTVSQADLSRWIGIHPWIVSPIQAQEAGKSSTLFAETACPSVNKITCQDFIQSSIPVTTMAKPESSGVAVTFSGSHGAECSRSGEKSNQKDSSGNQCAIKQEQCQGMKQFQIAFSAVSELYGVCHQMPNVRTALIPLKRIQEILIRNYNKFIFPEDHATVFTNAVPPPTNTTETGVKVERPLDGLSNDENLTEN